MGAHKIQPQDESVAEIGPEQLTHDEFALLVECFAVLEKWNREAKTKEPQALPTLTGHSRTRKYLVDQGKIR